MNSTTETGHSDSPLRRPFARRLLALAACATLAAGTAAGQLFAEKLEQDGLRLEVTPQPGKVPGYSVFQIKASNLTAVGRSLHAQIQLSWTAPDSPEGAIARSSECTAYLEIPARGELNESVPCKGTDFAKYEFRVVRVLPFIITDSPLKWQQPKSEATN